MPRVHLAERANQDLRNIRQYSKERFGAPVAVTYLNGLRSAIKGLARHPYAGPAQEEIRPDVRKLSYRSHAVYYRFDGVSVLVMRILHQAQDAPASLVEA